MVQGDFPDGTAGWEEVLRAPAAHGVSSLLSLLREVLFPSGSEEKLMSVRASFVRKIIDFCEGNLETWTRLLSTGSLKL